VESWFEHFNSSFYFISRYWFDGENILQGYSVCTSIFDGVAPEALRKMKVMEAGAVTLFCFVKAFWLFPSLEQNQL